METAGIEPAQCSRRGFGPSGLLVRIAIRFGAELRQLTLDDLCGVGAAAGRASRLVETDGEREMRHRLK
jgi:hypothetical protein